MIPFIIHDTVAGAKGCKIGKNIAFNLKIDKIT